jgi:predicted nucleic acid-binding protein
MKAILDTSVLYAIVDRDDVHHAPSTDIIHSVDEGDVSAVVTDYVVAETLNLIQLKIGHEAATDWHDRVNDNSNIELVHTSQQEYHRALDVFREFSGLSFVDASIVAQADRSDIETVLSFDTGFDVVDGLHRAEDV